LLRRYGWLAGNSVSNVADSTYFLRFVCKGLLRLGRMGTFADFYFDASISFCACSAFVHAFEERPCPSI